MAKILIHGDGLDSTTSVSNVFIDEYMSDANGEFVKIYLYLLRLMNAQDSAFSISSMADKFEHTEKDITRALSYWERMNLLRLEYDDSHNLTGVCLLDSSSRANSDLRTDTPKETEAVPKTDKPDDNSLDDSAAVTAVPAKKTYTPDELARFRENDQIAELLFITERYLGHPLTPTDVDTLIYLYDGLGFSTDLIEYLVEYCVSKGHVSVRYIQGTAIKWAENNIKTVHEAKQESKLHSQTYYAVTKAFGIAGRNLIPSEMDYIEKWKFQYNFTTEIITEACQRTMQSIHQPSFQYTDSILENWHKNQVQSTADIAKLDAARRHRKITDTPSSGSNSNTNSKNKFNNFKQRSYDYDQLEEMLLTTNVK